MLFGLPFAYSHSNTMLLLSRMKFIVRCHLPSRLFSIACTRGDCKSGDRYVSLTEQRTRPHNGTTLYVKRVCYVYIYTHTIYTSIYTCVIIVYHTNTTLYISIRNSVFYDIIYIQHISYQAKRMLRTSVDYMRVHLIFNSFQQCFPIFRFFKYLWNMY